MLEQSCREVSRIHKGWLDASPALGIPGHLWVHPHPPASTGQNGHRLLMSERWIDEVVSWVQTQYFIIPFSFTHLSRMHADSHLAIQVALADHVRTPCMNHPWRLQWFNEAPAQSLITVPPNHLLQNMHTHRLDNLKCWTKTHCTINHILNYQYTDLLTG